MSETLNRSVLWRCVLAALRGFDGPLLFALAVVAAIGLTAMYSSGFDHGTRFAAHARNLMLTAAIVFAVAQIAPQRLQTAAVPLYAAGVALLLAVALFGVTKKGATRWIDVGVVVQPSELLKIATPLMLAWWFQKREGQLRVADYLVAAALLALPVALIMKQPDLGTALLVGIAGLAVIFFAGLSWKLVLPLLLAGAVAVGLVVWFEPQLCAQGVRWSVLREYQQQRICTLLDPMRDPLNKGFHTLQGMIAIGSGGLWGKGFMQGTQTHLEFIPERTTDFIFAAWSEEFGLLGNLVLLLAYAVIVLRIYWLAGQARTLFARLLGAAIGTIFFAYAFVNMAMVSGILPVVGVPLPFVSYGGTAMVTLGLALGMLFSTTRERHR